LNRFHVIDVIFPAIDIIRQELVAGGVSATQGYEASTVKNTAPVSRTARSTSESVSVKINALQRFAPRRTGLRLIS